MCVFCSLRNSTSIGNKQFKDGFFSRCPIIENNVNIDVNVCIIGPIIVGNNVKIGAGCVVTKDIPSNSIVMADPAKIIKTI
ncbi:hypothetical protein FACS1894181_02620 [Bacteroidia bacterium]|nr:hypothetical protein FACS1894181_02620 [Bacteroidia bacterium]